MDNKAKISSVAMHYPKEREALFSLSPDDLFALVDDPESIGIDDLRHFVEKAIKTCDPTQEQKHQEERAACAAFIRNAQVVLEACAEDAPPHPQWSEERLRRVLSHADFELNFTIRQRDHWLPFGPDYMIKRQHMDGGSYTQRNEDWQRELAHIISRCQATIDQCVAIMKQRGLKIPTADTSK